MNSIKIYKNIDIVYKDLLEYKDLLKKYMENKEAFKDFIPEIWLARFEETANKLFYILTELENE